MRHTGTSAAFPTGHKQPDLMVSSIHKSNKSNIDNVTHTCLLEFLLHAKMRRKSSKVGFLREHSAMPFLNTLKNIFVAALEPAAFCGHLENDCSRNTCRHMCNKPAADQERGKRRLQPVGHVRCGMQLAGCPPSVASVVRTSLTMRTHRQRCEKDR